MPPVLKAGIARAPPALPAPGGGRSGAVGAAPARRLLPRLRPGRGAGARGPPERGVPLTPGQWQQGFTGVLPSSPPSPRRCCREAVWSPPPNPRAAPRRTPSPAASSSRSRSVPGTPRSRPKAWARRPRSARRSEGERRSPPSAPAAPRALPAEPAPAPHLAPPAAARGRRSGYSTAGRHGRPRTPVNRAFGSAAAPSPPPPSLSAPAERCATGGGPGGEGGGRTGGHWIPLRTSTRCLKPCGAPSYPKTAFYDQFY